jgi:hypothetical protein
MTQPIATVETITPAMAAAWLERNGFNRPLRNTHVEVLANDLRSGRWQLNGESIVFDDEEYLLDGQHRLWAIVEAEIAAPSVVVRGVKRSAFATIDTGMKRTGSDALSLMGVKNSTSVASAIRLIHYVMRNAANDRIINKMSPPEVAALYPKYDGVDKAAAMVAGCAQVRAIMPPSPTVAVMYFALKADEERAVEFFDGIATGENLKMGDPRLAVRSFFLTRKHSVKPTAKIQLAILIKAWNAFVQGRTIQYFKYAPSDAFPLPVGIVPSRSA